MDAKVTLSFNAKVIEQAKAYAESQGLSLSRLIEVMLRKLMDEKPERFEDYPVTEWVSVVAEGPATYTAKPRSNKELRKKLRERKR